MCLSGKMSTNELQDEAVIALNKIRPQHDIDAGATVSEADAVEQALHESKLTGQGGWLDLIKRAHLGRTIVRNLTVSVPLLVLMTIRLQPSRSSSIR